VHPVAENDISSIQNRDTGGAPDGHRYPLLPRFIEVDSFRYKNNEIKNCAVQTLIDIRGMLGQYDFLDIALPPPTK